MEQITLVKLLKKLQLIDISLQEKEKQNIEGKDTKASPQLSERKDTRTEILQNKQLAVASLG